MRKVMSPDGWTVEDEVRTSQGVEKVTYTVPCGSYVGVSHIVPHLDQNKSAHSLSLSVSLTVSLSLVSVSLICLRWGADSAKFNPDRPQLMEKSKDIRSFTTFSSGVHICPGRHVAMIVSVPHSTHLTSSRLTVSLVRETSRVALPRGV
jgi:hypothetical protein